jgi:response regulator of citrate/malate metabolism
MTVRVLVVEDEAVTAEAHAAYTDRVPGFHAVGIAHSSRDAHRLLESEDVDLVLLDMNLPDGHGLALLRAIRASGRRCDVIAVTAARDSEVVRTTISHGAVGYLIKPFGFAAFRDRLVQYADYRARVDAAPAQVVQDEVDGLFEALRPAPSRLPKGLSPETLRQVTDAVRTADARSATEVAQEIGSSRVTARRYLEHLADQGLVTRGLRYRTSGRPEVEYAWQSQD